jgi:pimeloyl-ACP methyl ester carboxylesterase
VNSKKVSQQATIILIPGLLCDQRVYSHLIPALRSRYRYQLCIFGLRDSLGSFIKRILTATDGPLILIGHSMGGKLAYLLAHAAPERIQALCIINSSIDPDTPEKRTLRTAMIEHAEQPHGLKLVADFIKKCTLAPNESVKKMMFDNLPLLAHQQSFLRSSALSTHDLMQITCPTLLIHSDHDDIFDIGHAQRMREVFPQAELHLIANSGHMSTMEQAEAVTTCIKQWLNRC